MDKQTPVILSLSGHDPTGGAGVAADIEAIGALGGHPLSIITCLTAQDSHNLQTLWPTPVERIAEQFELLLADFSIAAVKIGLLGSAEIAATLARLLDRLPDMPVVFDPVLGAGGGTDTSSDDLLCVIREQLLPRTTLLTPNTVEAHRLSGCDELAEAAGWLLQQGCPAVLLTGGHEPGGELVNRLYRPDIPTAEWHWPRLSGEFHGSGCTLASACAALLPHQPMKNAVEKAQRYTLNSLRRARRLTDGQQLPGRLPRTLS